MRRRRWSKALRRRRLFYPARMKFNPRWRYLRNPQLNGLLLRLAALAVMILIAIFLLDALLTPTIRALSELECRKLASSTVNESVLETLEKEQTRYEDLTVMRTNEDGLVTSISADVVQLNKLKAAVMAEIDQKFEKLQYQSIELPLLSIFGIDFLMGKGPIIQAHLKMQGESFGTFSSEFDSVGINQTRHRIYLLIESSVYLFWNGNTSTLSFETQICAAETVVVGNVPNVHWDYSNSSD